MDSIKCFAVLLIVVTSVIGKRSFGFIREEGKSKLPRMNIPENECSPETFRKLIAKYLPFEVIANSLPQHVLTPTFDFYDNESHNSVLVINLTPKEATILNFLWQAEKIAFKPFLYFYLDTDVITEFQRWEIGS